MNNEPGCVTNSEKKKSCLCCPSVSFCDKAQSLNESEQKQANNKDIENVNNDIKQLKLMSNDEIDALVFIRISNDLLMSNWYYEFSDSDNDMPPDAVKQS